MEIRTELPEIFQSFSQARQAGFISAKEFKESGNPLIGIFCTYFPQELALAMDAVTVGLCASSDETIAEAEKDLPRNLCPLIKSSYGFGKTDKCPYFYFSDLVVGETTCDGKKKMYEYMAQYKPVHVMKLPNSQDEVALELWKQEIIKMKEVLETQFGVIITYEKLNQAIRLKNEERRALKEFYGLCKQNPAPMTGMELFNVLVGASFDFNREVLPQKIRDLTKKVQEKYENEKKQPMKPRILITGCPMGAATAKVIQAIEDNGAVVVCFENCTGVKAIEELVDETNPDGFAALAQKYLNIGCSCMSPNTRRFELLNGLIDDYSVDGVVEMTLTACHTYNVESLSVKRFVQQQKGKPYTLIETDFGTSDVERINTRMTAFIEML